MVEDHRREGPELAVKDFIRKMCLGAFLASHFSQILEPKVFWLDNEYFYQKIFFIFELVILIFIKRF